MRALESESAARVSALALVCFSLRYFGCRCRDLSQNLLNGTLPDSLVNLTGLEQL
jgi:hypothetical protein